MPSPIAAASSPKRAARLFLPGRAGFSTLGTIDRVVYDKYEPLMALAAAAAVTERIGLCTSVLLGPLRPNAAELAKQALSLNALSGGRFTLGIGLGGREDDYELSGIEMAGRGKRLDAMLERMQEIWADGEVGPSVAAARGWSSAAGPTPPSPAPPASARAGSPPARRRSSTRRWRRRRGRPGRRPAARGSRA